MIEHQLFNKIHKGSDSIAIVKETKYTGCGDHRPSALYDMGQESC